MQFLNGLQPQLDLTYDDVFMVPSRSDVTSRLDVDLATGDGSGTTIPLVVANMTAIAGRRMAETVARRGALAVIPQDIPVDVVSDVTRWVKERHLVHDTPITLAAHETAGAALALLPKRAHGAAVVVDETGKRPIGVVTEADLTGVDRFTQVHEVMTVDPVLVTDGTDPEEAFNRLATAHHHVAPVVDDAGFLVGIITRAGALRARLYSPNTDASGRLRVAAAVGINGDVAGKARALLDAGVDLLVMDTAHGHQDKMLDALRAVRALDPQVPLAAGNVVSAAGTRDLIEAGADIVKVGVGPGRHVHDPDDDRGGPAAVLRRARVRRRGAAARSSTCGPTAGCATRGTSRSPWPPARPTSWSGRGSPARSRAPATSTPTSTAAASRSRSAWRAAAPCATGRRRDTPYERARKALFEEGISSARMFIDPERPSVEDVIDQIVAGVRSSFTYAGARTVEEFAERAVVGLQSTAGFAEGRPLHTSW